MSEGKGFKTLLKVMYIAVFISFVIFHFADAAGNYGITKPLVVWIVPDPSIVKIEGIKFGYDFDTLRYPKVDVDLRNEGDVEVVVNVFVDLYNVNATRIATGNTTAGPIGGKGLFHASLDLTWSGNFTCVDFAYSRVTTNA